MNKIITIILGLMLEIHVLTFTRFHQLKCTHRADMEEMVPASLDPTIDVFGVLERAIEKYHKTATPTQRRKSAENIRAQRKKGSEDDISRRKGEMLGGKAYDPRDMERDHSMEKLGRILDGKGSLRTDALQTPTVRRVQDHSRENSRSGSRKQSVENLKPDPVAMMKALKEKEEQEAKEAAEEARIEQEAKEAAAKAKREQEAKEAAEKAKKEQEAKEAAEKAKKEKEAKEAAEKAQREQEAKEAAEKARKEQEAKEAAEKAKKEQEAV